MVDCFGFGAFPNWPHWQEQKTSHCFPLSGNPNVTQANGLMGVQAAYFNSLQNVKLAGPTYFQPIIEQVRHTAARH